MFARYIVGVDGSGPSQRALDWAARRAVRDRAPLLLVYVAGSDLGSMGAEYETRDLHEGAVRLSTAAATLAHEHPGLETDESLLHGSASWELSRTPGVHDLLVVGTHKTGFLHGRALGSRSVQIAAACTASVAVIPDVDVHLRRGVVAGIDRTETAASVARVAAHEALDRGDELTLIQAIPPGDSCPDPERPLRTAIAAARAASPGLEVRSRVSRRSPAEALLNASRDKALLVLGPGAPADQRTVIGSVLHDVLVNVNAPVLVARPAEDRDVAIPLMAHREAGRPGS